MPPKDDIFSHVLCVGTGGAGGIASVIDAYLAQMPGMKCVRSHADGSAFRKLLVAFKSYASFMGYMLFRPGIRIVHIHSSSGNSFNRKAIFLRLSKLFGKKVVFHVHSGAFRTFRESNPRKVDAVLAKADVVVALSEEWKSFFTSIGLKKVEIVNNVIPTPMVDTSARKSREEGDPLNLLFLGLICRDKGIFDLVDALSENAAALRGRVVLRIGGNGYTDELCRIIKSRNLQGLVEFEGWVSGQRKCSLLSSADVFLLPSYVEGVPISLLEAMSYSLPVIATPVGGVPSIVAHMKNGIMVEPGDRKALVEAIELLADNPSLRKTMGEEGRLKARPHLAPEVQSRLAKLYQSLSE